MAHNVPKLYDVVVKCYHTIDLKTTTASTKKFNTNQQPQYRKTYVSGS